MMFNFCVRVILIVGDVCSVIRIIVGGLLTFVGFMIAGWIVVVLMRLLMARMILVFSFMPVAIVTSSQTLPAYPHPAFSNISPPPAS